MEVRKNNRIARLLRKRARGQTAVLVGLLLSLGVLTGLVALAVDGGSALLQRRNMQNGADAASLAVAQLLAANVVKNGSEYPYIVRNSMVTARVTELLGRNQGGTTGQPYYRTTVEYGTLISATTYSYYQVVVSENGTWTYVAPHVAGDFVPANVDAVRVTAEVRNPTTFVPRMFGVSNITVRASAAAALLGNANYNAEGPTWPMTAKYDNTYTNTLGLCYPVPFYADTTSGTPSFEGLISLAVAQGRYTGQTVTRVPTAAGTPSPTATTPPLPTPWSQLISSDDGEGARAILSDVAPSFGGRSNSTLCHRTGWSASANCSGEPDDDADTDVEQHGFKCCRAPYDMAEVDVPNFISYDFTGDGFISLTADRWRAWDGSRPPDYEARRSDGEVGDWPETYLSTSNIGPRQVVGPVEARITAAPQQDALFPLYGSYIEKVMYLYDKGEALRYDTTVNPPRYMWLGESRNSDARTIPDRVHMKRAFKFRFYLGLADDMVGRTFWTYPLHPMCGGGTRTITSAAVYGIPFGVIADTRPTTPGPHGLVNFVTFIDPNQ